MNDSEIQAFWSRYPCGERLIGGIEKYGDKYEAFFSDYDRFRYAKEPHIINCLDGIDFKDKRTLEIGLGLGADSEQIIRRGAIWSGIDLTSESVERVRIRLTLRRLPFDVLTQGSVLALPFDSNSFDIVFAHGVLHHVPNIDQAQREIFRVLKPDGELIVMLYSKISLNYLLSICVVRRLGLLAIYFANCLLNYSPEGIYRQHLDNARRMGIWRYLNMNNFIHKNTDGPLNPYSKVYTLRAVRKHFSDFKIARAYKRFMHAPPLPVSWLPLEKLLGWHLWVHMRPLSKS